jgi:pimeloyl-ACP methyl ester carboxylesterase
MIYSSRGFKKDKYQAGGLSLEQLLITAKGNEACVILLHGIGGSKISLTGLASVFAKKDARYDLILPDLPGSGSAIKLNFDDQTFKAWFEAYLKINAKKLLLLGIR